MRRRFLALVAIPLLLAACSGGNPFKSSPPSSHCADLVAQVWTGVIQAPSDITKCLNLGTSMGVKTRDDFIAFEIQNSRPMFYMGHGCGGYTGKALDLAYQTTLFKGLTVWVYAVTIVPGTYPTIYPYSLLFMGTDSSGRVSLVGHINNSSLECPTGSTLASSARTG
jgi:hypothetical protein